MTNLSTELGPNSKRYNQAQVASLHENGAEHMMESQQAPSYLDGADSLCFFAFHRYGLALIRAAHGRFNTASAALVRVLARD